MLDSGALSASVQYSFSKSFAREDKKNEKGSIGSFCLFSQYRSVRGPSTYKIDLFWFLSKTLLFSIAFSFVCKTNRYEARISRIRRPLYFLEAYLALTSEGLTMASGSSVWPPFSCIGQPFSVTAFSGVCKARLLPVMAALRRWRNMLGCSARINEKQL